MIHSLSIDHSLYLQMVAPSVASEFAGHFGPSSGTGSLLVAAEKSASRAIEAGLFANVWMAFVAFGIFIGTWIAAFVVGWALRKILLCGKAEGQWSEHDKRRSVLHAKHVPTSFMPTTWNQVFTAQKVQQQQPAPVAPASSPPQAKYSNPDGTPKLVSRRMIGLNAPAVPQPEPLLEPTGHTLATNKDHWHGHPSSAYENYVSFFILIVRMVIVLAGTIASFFTAGVSFVSLATGLGLISVSFSVGASSFIANVFASVTLFGTYKLGLNDFVEIGHAIGEITAMFLNWMEVTDDFHPLYGRRVFQVPNRVPVDTIVTYYPDGPPLLVIDGFYKEMEQIEAMVKAHPERFS